MVIKIKSGINLVLGHTTMSEIFYRSESKQRPDIALDRLYKSFIKFNKELDEERKLVKHTK